MMDKKDNERFDRRYEVDKKGTKRFDRRYEVPSNRGKHVI